MWRDTFVRYASQGQNLQNQIRTMIVDAILEGRLPAGSEVPSSREMSEALGVARNTVVLAYQQLVSKGYLLTRDRSGHFVNPEMANPQLRAKSRDKASEGSSGLPALTSLTGSPNWSERIRSPLDAQRNIVKRSDWQKVPYPFLYGQFDSSLFPTAEWRECCMKALSVADIREWAQDLIFQDDE
ncbi:MAG: GntR family transcriptional regulator, partial [Burkholderiaceae bacterium]